MTPRIEETRKSFLPKKVATLFVGESAPVRGVFFYFGTGQVHQYMRLALGSPDDFLQNFKARCWYLDDLVLHPVNHLSRRERQAQRRKWQPDLAQRIADCKPRAVVATMKGIAKVVEDAVKASGVEAELHAVPFPGTGRQLLFLDAMRELAPKLPTGC